jgi:CheY-like chemotaxis protein
MRHFSLRHFRDGDAPKSEATGETRGRGHGAAAQATQATQRGHDSPVWWIVPSGVALVAVIALGTAILVSNLRDRARADAKHALNTTAYIIAEHLEGTFQSVELAQKNAIERLQSFRIASSDDLDRLMSSLDAHLMLKDSVSGALQLDALLLVAPSGKLVGSSRKQSSGHVCVYSEVGQGTVFKLFLPFAQRADSRAQPSVRVAEQTARHSGDAVILAVDHNPDVRATVVMQLQGLGYRVREADSAHAALEILDGADRIDLLFTDMIMPGLNGKELATKARSRRPDLKVLFTSGFPGQSTSPETSFDDGRKRDLAKAVEEVLTARP